MNNYKWKEIHILDKFERVWNVDSDLCKYKYFPIIGSKYIYVISLLNNIPIQSMYITKKLMREKKLKRVLEKINKNL
jgi:hypothetical protein